MKESLYAWFPAVLGVLVLVAGTLTYREVNHGHLRRSAVVSCATGVIGLVLIRVISMFKGRK